jgi:hypothetical protein
LPRGFTLSQLQGFADQAALAWWSQASLQFAKTTGDANIDIQFSDRDSNGTLFPSATFGSTPPFTSNNMHEVVTLNVKRSWSGGAIAGVMTHEMGHALGLHHSDVPLATMFSGTSTPEQNLSLELDDKVAFSARYDGFTPMGFTASDVAVGPTANGDDDPFLGSAWAISDRFTAADGEKMIYRWDSGFGYWRKFESFGARRIAVGPDGAPWAVKSNGQIFHRRSALWGVETWDQLPGLAIDIGVGYNGDAWVIGIANQPGGGSIFKWNTSTRNWDHDLSGGSALRITVTGDGVPWVINNANTFFRYSSNDPNTGFWTHIDGVSDDLAAGPGPSVGAFGERIDYVWSLGKLAYATPLSNIAMWNEQHQNGGGASETPARSEWTQGLRPTTFSSYASIAMDHNGHAWLMDGNNALYRGCCTAPLQ